MKKIISLLLCLLILLCTGCGASQEEKEPEPLRVSDEIRIVTKDLESVEELTDKVLAVQETFDKEYSDYVIEQLAAQEIVLEEKNLHWFTSYADIKFLIDDGSIDAWVIVGNREDTITDYRGDYHPEDYKTIASYYKEYYEEEEVDMTGLVKELYSEPFMVILHGLDGFGENSVHEWKYYRNDVNHLLVVNPEKKHVLMISIPRDTRIKNVATGYLDKFTHFCQNGPLNPAESIGEVLDIDIPYYCMTSFTWFVEGINDLGGVTVDVPMDAHLDMDSTRNVANPQYLHKGVSHLFGESALALARNRKYDGIVNNDMGRIRNQALIINALIDKIARHPYLLDMVGMSWLMDFLCENNFSAEEKATLFALAKTFEDGYTIDNFFLDGEGGLIDGTYYVVTDPKNIDIAKGKIELVMTGKVSPSTRYYDDIMKGYVTGGTGTEKDGVGGYIGTYYDLNEVFGEKTAEEE
ncbi:MAG: LCP family protein [Erysipelotrichaceae bacterium]|nr:LCP family protein [Erysipelotrichaceae bacterium]